MIQESKLPYTLLVPVKKPKLDRNSCIIITDCNDPLYLYGELTVFKPGPLAVDIETNGTQAADPSCTIVGIGLSQGKRAVYIDFTTATKEVKDYLFSYLSLEQYELIAHNSFFDSAFITRDAGKWFNWKWDTYGLYRQLANEGFKDQKWSLKTAQIQMLGWDSTNETELDEWLLANEEPADIKKEPKPGYYTKLWKGETRYLKPRKEKMANAPANILGYYCCLDASSTYDLFMEVMTPAIYKLGAKAAKNFLEYHEVFMTNVKLNVYQQLRGIAVDKEALVKHHDWLETEIKEAERMFYNHEEIASNIKLWNQKHLDEMLAKMPEKFLKKKLGKQPAKYKKDGTLSKNYTKWLERAKQPPEISKNFLRWKEQYETAKVTNHFNLNSGRQRQWLFYEQLGYEVLIRTDKGEPAVDKRALLSWGEPGQLLKKSNDLNKELGYVNGCLTNLSSTDTINPQFRIPGTLTGRLAGSGGINFQQLPKSRGYLSCYRSRPGYVFVDCDHTSLEQVVLAELSRDPTLFKLYGPEAKPNDVYLFNGANLPGLRDEIRGAGYDPDNPTLEGIKAAKKTAKKARTVSKVVTLGSSYGMGPGKLSMTLKLQGIPCSVDEARGIHSAYWELYKGVKEYEAWLLDDYNRRDGWVFNGIGRPVCVARDLTKDIVNRVVQSTGHDLHMIWVSILDKLFTRQKLEVHGIVWDFHDQSIVEVREEDAEEVKALFSTAYDLLNEKLEPVIPLQGDAQIVNNLAEAKLED